MGEAGRGSQPARGSEVIKNLRPGVLIASELWKLLVPRDSFKGERAGSRSTEAKMQRIVWLASIMGLPASSSGSTQVTSGA